MSFNIKNQIRKSVNRYVANHVKLVRLRFPTELEFEPIQLCNAKCFCCPYTSLSDSPDYTKQRMSRSQIEHLLVSFHDNLMKYDYHGVTTINPFRYSDPLICPDLDFILDYSLRNNLKVQITTNARGLNSRTIGLLEKNQKALKSKINISVLGSSEEEVKKNMDISLAYTLKRMSELSQAKSPLVPRILISLRVIDGTPEERLRLESLYREFTSFGVNAEIKSGWIHNRIGGDRKDQDADNYIIGCKLYRNKLLRRLEVMVNGDVVLCDDDAEGRKVFGNVFAQSIDEIWSGKLKTEHENIFSPQFVPAKKNLVCINCSRATYQKREFSIIDTATDLGFGNFYHQIKKKNYTTIG